MYLFISSFQGIRAVGQFLGYILPRNMSSTTKVKINFNSKHLTKGDPVPPYNGKLRLYNMRYCPYAQRAVLALNAKNIDYELVNIDLVDKPEWLASKSAFTKVPALEIADGVSIYESLVVAQYLDDVYPNRPLLSKDPVKKAFDLIIAETTAHIHSVLFKVLRCEPVSPDVLLAYTRTLDLIQAQLLQRGTKFLDGEEPGYADYMVWPWFERLPLFDDENLKIDEKKYKVLVEYLKNMVEDPVVKEYSVPKDIATRFYGAYARGEKPNYDLLLEE